MKYIAAYIIILLSTVLLHGQRSEAIRNVDRYLENYLERTPIPGFAIAIVEDDQVIYNKAFGVERQGESKRMTPNSVLAIDALGRGFTAMAVLQLEEEGKLDLDDPVIQYLPWFQTSNKDFSDQITLRMCLSNTSGIPPQFESAPNLDGQDALKDFIASFEQHVIKRQPGMSHEFCDEGYSIIQYVIESVSGLDYADYIERNILSPLNMRNSSAVYRADMDILFGHEMDLAECRPAVYSRPDPNFTASGSQFYATTEDLSHYMLALLNKGYYKGQQVISAAGLEELFKSNTSFEGLGTMLGGNGIDIQYALGWMGMSIEDRDIMIHTGGNGKSGAILGINIAKNQAFAILFNADVNQFDRFEYPGMEHAVNNVIHLINQEDTTEFGLVRSNLVTEESYDLPIQLWEDYVGSYEPIGRQNPFFNNRTLKITRINDEYLELTVDHQNKFNGRYRLDFSTKARSTLRNIAQPRDIQFTIYPDGYVGGVFMFGTEFRKLNAEQHNKHVSISSPNGLGSFSLPAGYTHQWLGDRLSVTTDDGGRLNVELGQLKERTFAALVESRLADKSITSAGNVNTTTVKEGLWTEQSIFVKEGNAINQYIIALYQDPNTRKEMSLVLSQPYGSSNERNYAIIQNLQRTITF